MGRQIILRPCFNRPEMFYLSLEYEIAAREYHMLEGEFKTIFLVEYGTSNEVLEIIKNYPYEYSCINREESYGLSKNILEGFKVAFGSTSDYVVYIEDDVLVHKTYFQYMDVLLNMDVGKWSVLSPYNKEMEGDVNEVYVRNHYSALCPLINKDFYSRYVYPCSTPVYYNNPARFVVALNEQYKEYWGATYKYTDATHHQQAGMINRMVDVANINDDMNVIMPKVDRMLHIGWYGYNRRIGIKLPNAPFEARLSFVRNAMQDPQLMYEMTGSKEYNDYKTLNNKALCEWDGKLYFK